MAGSCCLPPLLQPGKFAPALGAHDSALSLQAQFRLTHRVLNQRGSRRFLPANCELRTANCKLRTQVQRWCIAFRSSDLDLTLSGLLFCSSAAFSFCLPNHVNHSTNKHLWCLRVVRRDIGSRTLPVISAGNSLRLEPSSSMSPRYNLNALPIRPEPRSEDCEHASNTDWLEIIFSLAEECKRREEVSGC